MAQHVQMHLEADPGRGAGALESVAREEANSSRFELNGKAGDDQDSEHQKPQPLNEAAEAIE